MNLPPSGLKSSYGINISGSELNADCKSGFVCRSGSPLLEHPEQQGVD